nr:hypothetical protein [uncultured Desulfobulbus sp.]
MRTGIDKLKRIIFFSTLITFIFLSYNNAYAVDCNKASVVRVGPIKTSTGDRVIVYLKNETGSAVGTWGAGTTRSFYLHTNIDNKGLATILTAFAIGNNVWVRIDDDYANTYSVISIVNIQ